MRNKEQRELEHRAKLELLAKGELSKINERQLMTSWTHSEQIQLI
jgi:hypothetical protein